MFKCTCMSPDVIENMEKTISAGIDRNVSVRTGVHTGMRSDVYLDEE